MVGRTPLVIIRPATLFDADDMESKVVLARACEKIDTYQESKDPSRSWAYGAQLSVRMLYFLVREGSVSKRAPDTGKGSFPVSAGYYILNRVYHLSYGHIQTSGSF